MLLTHLKVNNFRVFDRADFVFKPGVNLIVGINGVGKSSVLDLLRIMLSRSLPKISESKIRPLSFVETDFSLGAHDLTVELGFNVEDVYDEEYENLIDFRYTIHKNVEQYLPAKQQGDVRSKGINLPDVEALKPDSKEVVEKLNLYNRNSLGVYYSTRRSIPTIGKLTKSDDALLDRELNLRSFIDWWRVLESRLDYDDGARRTLSIMESVMNIFLDGCKNIRAVKEPEETLLIDKGSKTLNVRQLSDGERGMLALGLDLARRISDANPFTERPLEDAKGVVLIDEIDLHLHPRWQRDVASKLTTTFPNLQFIATTHSPQIVGEVPSDKITILENGKQPYPPDQSLGMDTNWILEFLMNTNARNQEFEEQLSMISDLIEDDDFEVAQRLIDKLKDGKLARDPELVRLQARLARFKLLKDNPEEN